MFNRLKWIALSYGTCAATVATVALAVVLGVFAVWGEPRLARNDVAPTFPCPTPAIRTVQDLDRVRQLHQQADVRGIDLLQLFQATRNTAQPETDEQVSHRMFSLLAEFPNLRWLNVGILISLQDFPAVQASLENLQQLEYLRLDIVGVDRDLSRLRSLPKLRWLELTSPVRQPDLAGLATLPALDTLSLMDVPPVTDRVLAEIVAIPGLKTLVIAPIFHPPGTGQPPQPRFDILRGAPKLKRIYFGQWRFGEESNPAAVVQAALPGMHVLPAFVLTRCDPAAQLPGIICALLAGALSYQLAVQFRGSPSRLMPGFGPPQALVAAIWCSITVLVIAWFLTRNGFSTVLALALAAAMTTAIVAVGTLALQSAFRKMPVDSPVLVLAPLWSLMVPTLLLSRPWWFEIYRGTTLAGCAAATVGMAAWLARRLRSGAADTPDVATLQGSFMALPPATWRGRLQARSCRSAERRIEALSTAPTNRTWSTRLRRWQLGNTPRSIGTVWFFTLIVLAFIVAGIWWQANARGVPMPFPWQFALIYFSALLPIQKVAMALGDWSGRIRSLPLESLRPVSNTAFRRELAAALVLDLAPAALLFACGAALAVNIDGDNQIDWAGLPVSFLIFLALGYLAMLATTLVLIARRGWLAMCVLAAAAIFSFFAVTYLAYSQLPPGSPLVAMNFARLQTNFATTQWQLWIPILLALLLTLVAAWRWRTMELADLNSP